MASTSSTIRELDDLRIPLEEIVKATNNFADENIIGKGGLGTVYKGRLLRSWGSMVDVSARRFDRRQGNIEFLTEISVLSSINHYLIVNMIGYCEERGEKIIVYTYQARGSLIMHLSEPVPASFTWRRRMKLCVQVAEAISFLHSEMSKRMIYGQKRKDYLIIHRNINSSTILLDKDMSPMLSGFEYSIQQASDRKDHIHLCEAIGTRGYMDPEILKNGGVNHKSDVYSFGVVLFEILCGRKAYQDNKSLVELAKYHYEHRTLQDIILPDLWKQMGPKSFKYFSEAAYSCLEPDWTRRPDIEQVLDTLEKALKQLKTKDVKSELPNYKKVKGNDVKSAQPNYKKVIKDVKSVLSNYKKNLENKTATWEEQLKMCIDNANKLNCLRNEMEIQKTSIHDTNSESIVLNNHNLGERINRYKDSVSHNDIHLDPEFLKRGMLGKEPDVLGFGVLLFEMLFGYEASELLKLVGHKTKGVTSMIRTWFNEEKIKGSFAGVLLGRNGDSKLILNKGPNEDSLSTFINIMSQCLEIKRKKRPTINVIVQELQKALTFQMNDMDNFKMSFEDIKVATQNFSLVNVIGGGGFGRVYKGKLAYRNGNGYYPIVAKKLDKSHGQGDKEFYNELQILCEYKHKNIIGLLGYSNETNEKIIVYEHASKGSLDKYLNDASLTWRKRLMICIDFATGLDFLHEREHAVIHRDIKSSNVLLFNDWKAKIGDFGLSVITSINSYTIDIVWGTSGYMDPLYLKSSLLTKKSDIYSFGVVLIEILCGKAIHEIHKYKSESLLSFIKHILEEGKQNDLVFKAINEEIVPNSLDTFLDIVYRCLHDDGERRPSSKEVLGHLKKALNLQVHGGNFTLDDIKFATQNFSLANEVEKGNFWSVYTGEFSNEDMFILNIDVKAIVAKKFDISMSQGNKQYYNEFQIVYKYKHENIIGLVTYINELDEKILVYERACKGSLDKYLNDDGLMWTNRLKICIDFASGLNFLHEGVDGKEAVIHRDIKSSNIHLFDDWKAKVGGFYVSSKISKNTNYTIDLASITLGYVDPLYLKSGLLTKESDIYSFGVVLFEILCGKVVYEIHKHENECLLSFIIRNFKKRKLDDVVFKGIKKEIAPKSLSRFVNIICQCLNDDPKKRPTSKEVLQQLRYALELQEDYDLGCGVAFVRWFINCDL